MYDALTACRTLGFEPEPATTLNFEIGELGFLVFENPHRVSLVLNQRSSDLQLMEASKYDWKLTLPVVLSCTTGGLLCYHLLVPSENNDTDLMLTEIDALIKQLAT